MNIELGMSLTEEDKVLRPANCIWAKFGVDVLLLTTRTTKPPQGYLAEYILKHQQLDFSYKSTELVLLLLLSTHSTTTTTTTSDKELTVVVLDLGDAFPQFRNCTMVWFMHHGLEAMAIVQTKFSSYMIFTRLSSANNTMRLSVANRTVRLTVGHKKNIDKDPTTTTTTTTTNITMVELKLCACCGKSAEQKCGHCWRTSKICIRYCSKACTVKDRPRHARVCGRDFSDEWKPAAAGGCGGGC